jgi:hypothetical protein
VSLPARRWARIHGFAPRLPRGEPPPGRSSARFANAACGSTKNITPKREKIRSTLFGVKAKVCASAFSKRRFASFSARARSLARASMGVEMSTPSTAPLGPTRAASCRLVCPTPQPTSSTRSPAGPRALDHGEADGREHRVEPLFSGPGRGGLSSA